MIVSQAADLDIVRESIVTFLSDSGDKLVAFAAFVFFANYFTTDAFGTAYTVIGISAFLMALPKSVGSAVTKRVSEDTANHHRFFILGLTALVGYTTLVAVVVATGTALFDVRFESFALAGVVHVASRPLLFLVQRVYDGVGQTGAAASVEFADGVVTAALRILLIVGFGMGTTGLLWAAAASAVLVGGSAYLRQFGVPTDMPTRSDARSLSAFAGPSIVARTSSAAYSNAPTVLAGTLISPTFASYVRSALTLTQPARLPVQSVIKSVFVKVSGDRERDERITPAIQQGIDVAGLFAIPLVGGAAVLGDAVMTTVFGSGYGGSGGVLFAVTLGIAMEVFAVILITALNGTDSPSRVAQANVVQAVVFVPAYIFAALFGGVGIFLVVFVLGAGTRLSILAIEAHRHALDVTELSPRFPAEQVLATLVMAATVAVANGRVPVASAFDLALLIGLGGATYGVALSLISSRCREIIGTVLSRARLYG